MSDLIDRRVSPRIPCDFSVAYKAMGARGQVGRITDIGTTGAHVTTQGTIPPVGAHVLLRFRLPLSHRPVQVVGGVRWGSLRGAGVEFIRFSPQEQDEVWRFYARESARQRGSGVRPPEPSDAKRDPEVVREGVLDAWRRFIREWGQPPD